MKTRLLAIVVLLIAICLIAGFFLLSGEETKKTPEELKFSDFPEVFKENTVIVIGDNASEIEKESAEEVATSLENLTGNKPRTISSNQLESFKYTSNLIILGTPNSNEVLKGIYNMSNATRVTEEYPGENKGVLEILSNPGNADVTFLGYASAAHIVSLHVLNHTKGENGADFRIDIHDQNSWNASINNTGNVTLTNIKVIIGEKVIQEIPKLEVNKQKDLTTLQPYEYFNDYILHIVCDQGVKEEIMLPHSKGVSDRFFKFNWFFVLFGIIFSILGFVGGILTRKKRKQLILYWVVFCIGILFLVWAGLNYIYLPPS